MRDLSRKIDERRPQQPLPPIVLNMQQPARLRAADHDGPSLGRAAGGGFPPVCHGWRG